MLWNMQRVIRHERCYGHPLHPNPTPDILTSVLTLDTVGRGRVREVDAVHLFLTIIQFHSARHLISQHTSKRRERKANTNGPPADSMTLTCSTCNRQFRARIGLVSHQRTHQHTRTYSRNNDGLSH